MDVWVNRQAIKLAPGMQVKYTVQAAGLWSEVEAGKRVYDDWGKQSGI